MSESMREVSIHTCNTGRRDSDRTNQKLGNGEESFEGHAQALEKRW